MSFGYPPLRPVPGGIAKNEIKDETFGLPNSMLHGPTTVRDGLQMSHPLEHTERKWHEYKDKMDFVMLRNLQGVHAPLRLQMERKSASQVSRLPFLQSSNLMLDSLTGKLDTIEYEDILNVQTDAEVMGQPHAIVEKHSNLL